MTRSAAPATSAFEPPCTETSMPADAVAARVGDLRGHLGGAVGVAGAQQDPLPRGGQAHGEPAALRPGAPEDPDDQFLHRTTFGHVSPFSRHRTARRLRPIIPGRGTAAVSRPPRRGPPR